MTTLRPYPSYRKSGDTKDRSLFLWFLVIAAIAAIIFGADRISGGVVRGYVREGGGSITSAVYGSIASITESGLLRSHEALQKENTELRAALSLRDERAQRTQELIAENAELREMARIAERDPGTTALVISSFDSSPYGTFLIGAGGVEGVVEGAYVLTAGGFVLGTVASVSEHSATVEALFAPDRETEMQVAGAPFIAKGRGGGNARGEVARETSVAEGDVVTVPGMAHRASGIVGSVVSASSSAYTAILIRTPVNLDALSLVYVVTPN